MKRLALLGCGLALSGCAALLNAGRPAYNGPLLTPLWHAADLEVVDTPLIGDGRVYAAARAGQSQPPRAYAFDAQTGRRLWVSSAPASGLLALAGGTVLAVDGRGTAHAVDARDGRTIPAFAPRPVAFAVAQDDAFYLTNGAQLAALRNAGQTRWSHALPIERSIPVVAGDTVYAFGRHHVDEMTPDLIGVYAFAKKSGTVRWKREWRQSFGKYRYDPKLRAMTWKVKPDYSTIAAVVADDRTAYVFEQLRDERLLATAQRIVAVDALTGTTKWQYQTSGFCLQAPVPLDPGELLVCDGLNSDGHGARYVALRRSDGAAQWHGQTSWNYERFVDDGPVAIVSDRRVHQMLNENGTTSPDSWLTGVDRRTGRELWRTPQESLAVFTLPAVGDGLMVVGSAPFTWADPQVAGSPGVAGLWAWKLPRP